MTPKEREDEAEENIALALTHGNWQQADQVYAVIAMTHAILAVSARLEALTHTLETHRDHA